MPMENTDAVFHHILVPTDGSEASVTAGQLAIRLAAFHRARMTFVYVVDASVVYELANDSGMTAQQVREELEATGRRYLNHLERLAAQVGQKAEQIIRLGEPHSEIESLARQLGVDLIVMGRVGQRGPRRILIGSVTERVLEYAPCPVLIVSGKA
jgi:nucleotide-binding universal stress UspA family protein